MKKAFRLKLKVKNCDTVFSPGLEPGVLGFRDIEYDLTEDEYKHPLFVKSLLDERSRLFDELVFTETEEIE